MFQNNSNVSILSLLDKPSESDNRKDDSQFNFSPADKNTKSNEELNTKNVPINEWVSRFQTKLGISQGNLQFMSVPPNENLTRKSMSPEVGARKRTPSTLEQNSSSGLEQRETVKGSTPKGGISKTESLNGIGARVPPSPVVLEHLKRFQTSFESSTSLFNFKRTSGEIITDKKAETDKTPSLVGDISLKKKYTPKKRDERIENNSKKRKTEIIDKQQKEERTKADAAGREDSKNKKNGKLQNAEEKKSKKTKKKIAEEENQKPENNKQQKQKISSTMTTEKNDNLDSVSLLPSPTIIEVRGNGSGNIEKDSEKVEKRNRKDEHDISSGEKQDEANRIRENKAIESKADDDKNKEKAQGTGNNSALEKERSGIEKHKEHEKEKPEKPIIALHIPLLDPKDPKPGQAEAVVNVLKLAEEKYGWAAMHPNAKSALEMMDEIVEDEDDGVEEEVEEEEVADGEEQASQNPSKRKRRENDEELNEEELARRHEIKMNRKVGKYDYEDPFIDDEELQWEEEITSTKEGFFVYWGPLADDKNKSKKGTSKKK